MPADELMPSPEKPLSDIGILQNEALAIKDHIQAQNEVINHLKNTLKAYQNSNDTYLHQNLGGNTMVLPKTEGTPIDEPEKKIPEPMGEPHPKPTDVLQIGSPETFPKSFLQYDQYLEPKTPSFQRKKKINFLKKYKI